jgi:hypothetical protein
VRGGMDLESSVFDEGGREIRKMLSSKLLNMNVGLKKLMVVSFLGFLSVLGQRSPGVRAGFRFRLGGDQCAVRVGPI